MDHTKSEAVAGRQVADDDLIFWNRHRVRRLSICLLLGFGVSALLVLLGIVVPAARGSLGDFPAFYSAAQIVAEGRPADLYSLEKQAQQQSRISPLLQNRVQAYAYPPQVALMMSPLSRLDFLQAKRIWVAAMLIVLLAAIATILAVYPTISDEGLSVFALLLAFTPVFHGCTAGQNSALSLLCLSGIIYGLSQNSSRGDWIAGVALGCWLFKPQFACSVGVVLLLLQRWRPVLTATCTGFVWWAIGALWFGSDWLLTWYTAASNFSILDREYNGFQMIGIPGVMVPMFRDTVPAWASMLLSLSVIVVTIALTVWTLRKSSAGSDVGNEAAKWSILGPMVILASPHALYYDLGLALFPLLALVVYCGHRVGWFIAGLWIFCGTAFLLRDKFSVTPLCLVSIVLFAISIRSTSKASLRGEN